MDKVSQRPEVFWCGNKGGSRSGSGGWSFPSQVRTFLENETRDRAVLHLFGGLARFGTRLDIDPLTRPDVIGDAWLPPFARDSLDVVILDPPYFRISSQMTIPLLQAAAWIARESVIWFHTTWIPSVTGTKLSRSWLVRVGDYRHIRCLQIFRVQPDKPSPATKFKRGPAIKYNRWNLGNGQGLLPLVDAAPRDRVPNRKRKP